MTFATLQDSLDVTNEMPWEERDMPVTVYDMLRRTTDKFGQRPAISYQLLSGPDDKAETLTWQEFHDKVVQTANLFRSLKLEKDDVIALVMPNSTETAVALIGAMVAGIANPINRCLSLNRLARSCARPGPRWLSHCMLSPKPTLPRKPPKRCAMRPMSTPF